MKRIITIVLILISYLSYSQTTYISFTKSKSKSGIQSSTPSRVINDQGQVFCEVDFEFPGAFVNEKKYMEHGDFSYINIKGFATNNEPGKPALPIRNSIIALPGGETNTHIEIVEQQYVEYDNYRIHPALKPASDTYGAAEPEFEMDYDLYATDAFYPANVVEVNNYRKLRGIPIASVKVCPVQFNPVTNKIRVYSKIKYKISFSSKSSINTKIKENTTKYNNYIRSLIVNPKALPEQSGAKAIYDKDRKDYIILTHTEFDEAATKLAIWKRQLGYTVEIVSRDDWTAELIDFVLKERYTSWIPKPDYFVIIGDHDGDFPVPGKIMIDGSTMFASDNRYSCMDGVNDYEPDIAKGRIPARTKADADLIVQRIIAYEKNPSTKESFYSTTLNCAYFQDDENDGYATRRFCQTSEEIKEHMLVQGYNVERVYATDSDNPTNWNNTRYSGGELIPEALHKENFPWVPGGGGKDDIVREWNEGKFLIFHRDHGYTGGRGWADPHFMNDNIPELDNTTELPVVFSINCHTGQFIETECFSELLMTNESGGAVGVLSAAQSSYSGSNDALTLGFYDAIWPGVVVNFTGSGGADVDAPAHEPIYNMGDILNYGLMRMLETWPAGQNEYQCDLFHYFGDPTMEIRTEFPTTITATLPATIGCSQTSLAITNCNIADALVTICLNDKLVSKTTLSGGQGELNFDELGNNADAAVVTISDHNTVPLVQIVAISGTCDLAPLADFESGQYVVSTSTTLQFSDKSQYNPSSLEWSFSPDNVTFVEGTDLNSSNPKVQFLSSGVFSVTLKATNEFGDNTKTKTDYIVAKAGAPANVSSLVISSSVINLTWDQNLESNNVMIAFSSDGVFGTPEDGKAYTVGQSITGGGEIAFAGSESTFMHSDLPEFSYTHYKLWSYTTNNEYSYIGITHADQTAKSLETPYLEPFTSGVKPDLVSGWHAVEKSNISWETNAYTTTSLSLGHGISDGFIADDWIFSPGLEMQANEEYRISFKIKGSNENLIVNYGVSPDPLNANQEIIFNQTGINEELVVVKNITPTETGVYYIGFYHYGSAQSIYIDDVSAIKLSSEVAAYWLGGTLGSETDWNAISNWSSNEVPTATIDVHISSNAAYYPIVDEVASCKELYIYDDAKLTVESGAELTVNNNLWTGGGSSGEFEMNGGIVNILQNYCGEDNSVTDINDGVLNISKSWVKNLKPGFYFCRGIAELSGGKINITENVAFGGNSRWQGTMDGPIVIKVGNNYRNFAENWTITDGTVILTGSLDGDSPTVFSCQDKSLYYNLIINGEGERFDHANSNDIHVKNDLIIQAGDFDIEDCSSFIIDGDLIVKSGQTFNANGAGNHTINGDLIIECSATVTNQNSIIVNGTTNSSFCGEPITMFSNNVSTIVKGGSIQFTDLSINTPTSWEWTFDGGSTTNSSLQNPLVTYNTVGTYSVTLKTTNSSGNNTLIKTAYIFVTEPDNNVLANFHTNNVSTEQGSNVSFLDLSSNNPTEWMWTFEGGTPATSTDQNPVITYDTPGIYNVTLSTSNTTNTNQIEKNNYIIVSPVVLPVIADFETNQSVISTGNYIDFIDITSNEPLSWEWKFEGGTPEISTDQNPVVLYETAGKYNVSLSAFNAAGYNAITKLGVVNVLSELMSPESKFSSDAICIDAGASVTYTDESLNEPTNWAWTFEGGVPETSTEQNPTVTYSVEGRYKVSLETTNNYGNSTKIEEGYITVGVTPTYCVATHADNTRHINLVKIGSINNESGAEINGYGDYTSLSTQVVAGKSYEMTVEQTHNMNLITMGIWIDWNVDGDFDDANELVYSHGVDEKVSPYNLTIEVPENVSNGKTRMRVRTHYDKVPFSCGYDSKATGEVEDYTIIIASNTATSTNFGSATQYVAKTKSVDFFDASISNPTSWSWVFEGGTPETSTEQNPIITYNIVGKYNVSLISSNENGSSSRVEVDYIEVGESSVVALFTADKTSVLQGETVNFTDQSEGNPISWNWAFEGGTPATSLEQNPMVTYSTPGQYNVQLTVGDDETTDTKVKESYININDVILVSKISIAGTNIIDVDNGTSNLVATLLPETAQDKTINWGTSDANIATVDANGLVSAVNNGVAVITVTAADGSGVYEIFSISITNQIIAVASVSIAGANSINVNNGTIILSTSVLPENATDKMVLWSTSDATIATVDDSGLVTALKNGMVTIAIAANDNSSISSTHEIAITNQTTGINTMGNIGEVVIKPNPFASQLQISIPTVKETTVNIELYNTVGEHVYKQNAVLNKGDNTVFITPSIIAGIYYLSISTDDIRVTKKVVKF